MPRRYKPRRAARKGKARRGKRTGRKTVVVNRAITPVPQRFLTQHKYSTTFTLGSLQNIYRMNLNSLYDPDQTGTGHQPYGFDQMAALFNRYRVYGVSYQVQGYQFNNPIRFGCVATNDSASPSNLATLVELPRSKTAIQINGGSTAKITGYVNLPSLTGRTKAQYMADDRYQAQNNTNPQEALILNIMAQSLSDTALESCTMLVTMNFHVEWFDPIVFASS